jgi:uncharacterized protein with HEPN domain
MKGNVSDKARLKHILESIQLIEDAIKELTFEELTNKPLLRLGFVKSFEIIGEASRYLSDETKNKHQEINWRDMVGLRNFLVHEYFDIDYEAVWKAAFFLKDLKIKLEAINTD